MNRPGKQTTPRDSPPSTAEERRLAEQIRRRRRARFRWFAALGVFLLMMVVYVYLPRGVEQIYRRFPAQCPAGPPCIRSTFQKPHPDWPPLILYTKLDQARARVRRAARDMPRTRLLHVARDGRLWQLVYAGPALQLEHDLVIRLTPRGEQTGVEFFARARVGWAGRMELLKAMKRLRTGLTRW
ncbi:MAG: DUF1499 domain-containing protein [Proteobacteria bacterium]|nr:DUF1499 domain-containing protein [Pseudomonadota bacterium]